MVGSNLSRNASRQRSVVRVAPIALAMALVAGLAAEGCRSKLDVTSQAPKKPAAVTAPPVNPPANPSNPITPPIPTEVIDGLSLQQTHYQPGQVVYVLLKSNLLQPGVEFSVVNETANKELIPLQNFGGEGQYNGYFIEKASDDNWVLIITPKQMEEEGALVYTSKLDVLSIPMKVSPNVLRLTVQEPAGTNPRFAKIEVVVAGFDIFGTAVTMFDSGLPAVSTTGEEYQFQGWVNVIEAPMTGAGVPTAVTVTAADGTRWLLSSGMFNILQR